MSDAQLPPVPVTQDKRTRDWFTAASQALKGMMSGPNRLVKARELVSAGIAQIGPDGELIYGGGPSTRPTSPPRITGLAATGAMSTIFLTWDAPSFQRFARVEVWRANVNDIGQAYQVGSTTADTYSDPVGSGATRYYWVRAVNDSSMAGPWNDDSGVEGKTSLSPTYVMQMLTSQKWQASTAYDPFNYVIPTTANGHQYRCVDGGVSAAGEPTWPTTINETVVDGTVTWRCVEKTERVPFAIGEIGGDPAVVMWTAYIENAAITNAMIGDLSADKITAGTITATDGVRVGSKIWLNSPDYLSPGVGGPAGIWMGMLGGVPRLQLTTQGDQPDRNLPDFYRRFTFDGTNFRLENVDVISSADGEFDDLSVDSLYARAVGGDAAAFKEYLFPSKHIDLAAITDPSEFEYYLGYSTPHYRQALESVTGTKSATTDPVATLIPYNERSLSRVRSYDESIGFAIRFEVTDIPGTGSSMVDFDDLWKPENNTHTFRIKDQHGNTRLTIAVGSGLGSGMTFITDSGNPVTVDGSSRSELVNRAYFTDSGLTSRFVVSRAQMLLVCADDEGALEYTNGDRFYLEASTYQSMPGGSSFIPGSLKVWFQLSTIPFASSNPGSRLSI